MLVGAAGLKQRHAKPGVEQPPRRGSPGRTAPDEHDIRLDGPLGHRV
jgi:hypothetical protein